MCNKCDRWLNTGRKFARDKSFVEGRKKCWGVVRKLDFRKLENNNSNFINIKYCHKVRNIKKINSNF